MTEHDHVWDSTIADGTEECALCGAERSKRQQKRPPRDRQIKSPRRDREEGDDHD